MRLTNFEDVYYTLYGLDPTVKTSRGETRQEFLRSFPTGSYGAEVGVAGGKHANWIYPIVQPSKLVLIDHWEEGGNYGGTYEGTLRMYESVVRDFGDKDNVEIIKSDSVTAADNFPDESFDWVYVDGNHTYEGVYRDLEAWWPKVKKGGFISGDDYFFMEQKFGVKKALDSFFPEDKGIYLEVQSNDPTRTDKNGKPWIAYSYKVFK